MKPKLKKSSMGQFVRARLALWRKKLIAFFWANIMLSVTVCMTSTWFTVSWFVYQAEQGAQGSNITSYTDSLWWGVVTFLTIGYGDRFPVTLEGRAIAVLLMFAGVTCVGIMTAKISSVFLERALMDGRGIVDTAKLKNHFIICGWSEDMVELLIHILDFNPYLSSREIVIVAHVEKDDLDAIRAIERLKDLQIINGDHFNEINLRRAAPERAKKVLILADRTPGHTGQIPTPTEVDARTIMTAMTLSNLARGTLVTAEILDPKMDHYLKLASVTEIIYSSEYSRLLLGNASSGTGIANIIFDLLDAKAGAHITSVPIPEQLHNRTYQDVKKLLEKDNANWLVIGLLENSGNTHSIRERALKRAQQTIDMAQLVTNLMSVKEIRCNSPVFHPPGDRVVTESTMAIVIAKVTSAAEMKGANGVGSQKARPLAA